MRYTKSLGLCLDAAPEGVRRIKGPNNVAANDQRVLIADPSENWRDWLSRKFMAIGIEPLQAAKLEDLREIASRERIDVVVTELSFADGTWLEVVRTLQASLPEARIVIVTGTGSIASAVGAVKHGVTGYLVKPVTPEHILKVAEPDSQPELPDTNASMSLDRAIWEYLTQTVVACGSIAGAARSLSLDRRSLRRMLSKNPPAR